MQQPRRQQTKGFTLLELSIVLTIIGLIAGGVLLGRELIRSAAIRSTIAQYQSFINAVNIFEQKYKCIPGDCPNATTYFGTNAAGCAWGTVSDTPSTATCNGTGDGKIAWAYAVDQSTMEIMFFWQHLAAAGLIEGKYSGLIASGYGSNIVNVVGGINAPTGKLDGTSWTPVDASQLQYYMDNYSSWFLVNNPPARTAFYFGGRSADTNFFSNGAGIFPIDAAAIDSKLDDGMPGTGNIQAYAWTRSNILNWTSNCTTNTAATSTYRVTDNADKWCAMFFKDPFE